MELSFAERGCYRTSFGIGGRFTAWCKVSAHTHDAIGAARLARRADMPIVVLGDGTNVLVADCGYYGMALQVSPEGSMFALEEERPVTIFAFASATWDELVNWSVARGWQGLECMSGIPGTVGGAIAGSIGAYGQQIADTVVSVETIDLTTGEFRRFSADECRFGYRTSAFNRPDGLDRYLITGADFRLRPGAAPCRAHPQLKTIPDGLSDMRRAVLALRRGKGMLARQHRSAGSFFKNPTVKGIRLSAAWLIEEAGFAKGYTRNGRAGLSPDHVLALVNLGGATANDIVTLAREIQEKIVERFGILLEPEVRLVGFPEYPLLTPAA